LFDFFIGCIHQITLFIFFQLVSIIFPIKLVLSATKSWSVAEPHFLGKKRQRKGSAISFQLEEKSDEVLEQSGTPFRGQKRSEGDKLSVTSYPPLNNKLSFMV
jgi:hypothetical protein